MRKLIKQKGMVQNNVFLLHKLMRVVGDAHVPDPWQLAARGVLTTPSIVKIILTETNHANKSYPGNY